MSNRNSNNKNRRTTERFVGIPTRVVSSANYVALSYIARALLLDIVYQYNGYNNGGLICTWSFLHPRGWSSKTTVSKHLKELVYYGFLVKVQQGGINVGGKKRPNLYAITWNAIDIVTYHDEFYGKTMWKVNDIPGNWKKAKPSYYSVKPKRKCPKELLKK